MASGDIDLSEIDALPKVLRALLDAELAAGNEVTEVGHSFPAPPVGAYFKLAKPVTTRARAAGGGISFRDFNSSIYSGEFTDEARRYFILEPPGPPPREPDMDAIRAARYGSPPMPVPTPRPPPTGEESPVLRFEQSMILDYEKWREGIGYDIEALRACSPAERGTLETKIIISGVNDWRDVEALAELNTPSARNALEKALKRGSNEVKLAVVRYAPDLVPDSQRMRNLVKAVQTAAPFAGLSQTLGEVEDFHPPKVVEALFKGALHRDGEVAVHFAAMLMFLHGKASEAFDWDHRPFFLRFHAPQGPEREVVFRELCERVGVDPARYLRRS